MKIARPKMIIITIDEEATDADVQHLIANLEASSTVFNYTPAYRGRMVHYDDALKGKDTWK